jgi:3-methyladenine DNA glycosylase AlkD
MQWIEDRLRELADRDGQYREFNARVVATADPATMLGVRVPKLRRLAREVSRSGDRDAFLAELPHRWYEEYLVHAFVLNETREMSRPCAF